MSKTRHPDAIEIIKFLQMLDVKLAISDWKQLEDFIDAAVKHAARRRLRRETECQKKRS